MRKIWPALAVMWLLPVTASAWGKEGHEIVAEIAMQYVKPAVKQNILYYLQGASPEETATWMDDIRSDHTYDYMKPWHYVNIEEGQTYTSAAQPNVAGKIQDTYNDLKDPAKRLTAPELLMDLRILFHLTGDLHQPLHVGYGSDKGGNTVQVRFGSKGTNLHHVWDTDIIKNQNITLNDCLALGKTLSPADLKRIRTIDVMVWMNDSRALLKTVYAFQSNKLGDDYIAAAKPLIERQLLYAGIRLAAILDQTFRQRQVSAATGSVAITNSDVRPNPTTHKSIYSAEEATAHIGEQARVCDHVTRSKKLRRGKGIIYFMGGNNGEAPFSIIIFSDDYDYFSYNPASALKGKSICVSGKIKDYKGHTEIVVDNEKQIQIQ